MHPRRQAVEDVLLHQKYRLHGQPRADDVAHDQIRVVELTGESFLADPVVAMVLGMSGKNAPPDLGRNVSGGPIDAYLPTRYLEFRNRRRGPRDRTSVLQLRFYQDFSGEVAGGADQLGSARAVRNRISFVRRQELIQLNKCSFAVPRVICL